MNTPHALDEVLVDLAVVRRRIVRHFLRDQTIDADERAILAALDEPHDELARYRNVQRANQSAERNGMTRRTRDLYREAGYDLIDLAVERQARRSNVVQFPAPDTRDAG